MYGSVPGLGVHCHGGGRRVRARRRIGGRRGDGCRQAAGFDVGYLGQLVGAEIVGVLRLDFGLLRLGARQCSSDEGLLGVFAGLGRRLWRWRFAAFGKLGACLRGLRSELGGLLGLLAFLAEVAELETFACLIGGGLVALARPDLALGEAEVVDQRDVRRAHVGAAAAFYAVE